MPNLRLALCQVNPAVGDLTGNARLVRTWTRRAAGSGAQLVLFPEMMLTGYPVEDLVFRRSFVAASKAALEQLARDLAADGLGELPVVVGYLDADGPPQVSADAEPGRGARNAAALLHRGEIVATYFKHHLPNYGVFDEDRYFVPGDMLTVVRLGGVDVALTICEDLWQAGGPFAAARQAGVGLVVNINGSPYELNKDDLRLPVVRRRAAEAGATIAYVNMIGGQDELVFEGDSMIVAADGTLLARAPQFVEHLLVHDVDLPAGPDRTGVTVDAAELAEGLRVVRRAVEGALPAPTGPTSAGPVATGGIIEPVADEAEVWQALVLGLRDYVDKNRFPSVVLGLSGGIDSAVVAAIAVDALGGDRVVGVSLPSQHSSEHSREDAADLAKRTGLDYRIEPIQPMVDTFLANMSLSGVAVENLQARVRGVILMALSNQEGHLVLTTGNKSELAVGYSTLYGDSVGGFNPIKDVWKTLVWRLAKWRNAEAERLGGTPPIPENSIGKPPSAELSPGQLDSDSLPDYDVLDPILIGYIDGDLGREGLVTSGHDPAVVDKVLRMVDTAEYKRRQSAPGTKISMKAFGRDRRLPITNRWREDG
ncbi:NAD+ synthase (glutamine-hydrolysing) [Micromonospora phaseoli]|uniref:Glutamine-dependent NAD(+) synthetase n=1 Tax=Micromonospora phaseoli TaxID=1144548 RepID=A0A1H7CBC3_9ACTN|nr:NAD+ synthase [Micromonospora phaseoli]PZV97973.1 NAD+ synthase (glutamine-hydrolysing) [Micromonospora phaseoli]GIJ81211.1 NAD+ synthase (glutamine-hydrolysing) [Micromonospora phaseoli]SEJ86554.1 NAD+ synthase (glutamine-hydrolysing) [Micromonospora phaseoli]